MIKTVPIKNTLVNSQTGLLSVFFLLFFINCFGQNNASTIIPKPNEFVQKDGVFKLTKQTVIFCGAQKMINLDFLQSYLTDIVGFKLETSKTQNQRNSINLVVDTTTSIPDEGYKLTVETSKINIIATTESGLFYGIQSLTQLINKTKTGLTIQNCVVNDSPRFAYRGMHLDVARHIFSVQTLKKWLNILAFYKLNTFHWHLTDDQGWRIEIKKYPELQSKSAWRDETIIGHKRTDPHLFDGKKYGGFYTQEEVKEIVKYASERFITVIPEIEMPGHARSVLAAYPALGCTGGPYGTANFWGVFDDIFCAGNEQTFEFLENVLDEVIPLFPSKYIHIGGDESPKTRWEVCPKCQNRIKSEHLKDEHELQSYFIQRIEKYVNSKGKKIIGWDEILEGGLAADATVMSWRGEEGGIAAAKQKHDVIMTPEKFVYLDYYQSLNPNEPIAAGGYTNLKKVYDYEPVPAILNTEEQAYIKGVQANVWSEYLDSDKKAEYMIFPRIIALAEIAWSRKESKNYPDFLSRLDKSMRFLKDVNAAKSYYEITGKSTSSKSALALHTDLPKAEIRYTTDGTEPKSNSSIYKGAIYINKTTLLKARVFKKGIPQGKVFQQELIKSLATGHLVTLKNEGSGNYNLDKQALVNGIQGTYLYNNGEWLGLSGSDFDATIDLGSVKPISEFGINVLNYQWQKMHPPKLLTVEISTDNVDFHEVCRQTKFTEEGINKVLLKFNPTKARYVRIRAVNEGIIPEGFYGSGTKAWLLLDEIIIN
ncbi:hexosaminidase [Pedobacter sp. UYP30]|uniref:glycoside hydrolase family 20 protein n=1 Tax=Pedobacter sp. UYP30 TaxID=1756400 RepID=UPI003398D662